MKKYPKYLLYIHHPKFAEEKNKSQLASGLIDKHYGGKVIIANGVDPIKRADLTKPVIKNHKDVVDKLKETAAGPICEHGAAPGLCKKSKCKNGKK